MMISIERKNSNQKAIKLRYSSLDLCVNDFFVKKNRETLWFLYSIFTNSSSEKPYYIFLFLFWVQRILTVEEISSKIVEKIL